MGDVRTPKECGNNIIGQLLLWLTVRARLKVEKE